MSGVCAGCGITTEGGELAVSGTRSVEWPGLPAGPTSIAEANGLRCDPVTGHAWVSPDCLITRTAHTGAGRNVIPPNTNVGVLHALTVSRTATALRDEHVQITCTGGYCSWRLASGNWWVATRLLTTYINGAPVATSGNEPIGGLENNSGGILTVGSVCDAVLMTYPLQAGDTLRQDATYYHQAVTLVPNAANVFTWRPPELRLTTWSEPLP